jgi:hypothetical protein
MDSTSRKAADDGRGLDSARDFLHWHGLARRALDDTRGVPDKLLAQIAEDLSGHLNAARPLVEVLERAIRERASVPAVAKPLVRSSSKPSRVWT